MSNNHLSHLRPISACARSGRTNTAPLLTGWIREPCPCCRCRCWNICMCIAYLRCSATCFSLGLCGAEVELGRDVSRQCFNMGCCVWNDLGELGMLSRSVWESWVGVMRGVERCLIGFLMAGLLAYHAQIWWKRMWCWLRSKLVWTWK